MQQTSFRARTTRVVALALGGVLASAGCRSAEPTAQDEARPEATPEDKSETIHAPAGFHVELLHRVVPETQGSWVSLCADESGRLYASDQYGGLWRVTPASAGVDAPPVIEAIDVELGEAHGLLWAFDSLYVVVNHGETFESGLYRLTDTDDDDALDTVEHLRSVDGWGEHGPHAVLPTPDGEGLVIVAGNHTALPDFVQRSRVPRVWDEDAVLPRIDDPNGHAVGVIEPAGWVCRTDRDGQDWELLACGFRNAYDLAFDPAGELFTFDSDMEWDTGLPWYRPTRILHVTSGAEFGWRSGSTKWPDFVPDSLGSVVDVGLTSPTGIAFGTDTHFPERWRRALFAADWAYGKIYAVHLEPQGASYSGSFEPFVEGEALPVTDLVVGVDGALYFTTGGRRTESGLYRVTWVGEEQSIGGETPPAPTDAARRRLAIEELHRGPEQGDLTTAWEALDDPDRTLRFAARTAIELREPDTWRARALAETRPRASIEALLALVRCDPTLSAQAWISIASGWSWESMDRADRLAALRVVGLGLLRVPGAEEVSGPLGSRLLALLPSGDDILDRELCRVLARMQSAGLVEPGLALLESAASQEAAVHHAYALSILRTGWDDASRARLLRWLDVDAAKLAGGVSFEDYLAEIRRLAVRNLGGTLSPEPASSEPDAATPAVRRTFVNSWRVTELEPELEGLSSGRSFERGRELFTATRCFECHRIAGGGGSTGPDLSGAGGRFSAQDMLVALLEPSASISDQYRDVELWTRGGDVLVGRLVSIEDGNLTLRTTQDARITVREEEVEARRTHPLSRMPEGLLDTCTEEEILDLMAYVLAGGQAKSAAFR